ncbi:hypothetical protein BRD17_02660 [Halobacteriales archaeon SW_7_68_16]|nr:MAG: hypothetical protein BRD17_02660 [Halobacteriales archaeon SW_7_68_16]
MYGLITRNEPELTWPEFDRTFFEVTDVTGRSAEPSPDAVNAVSCFGDTAAGEASPELVPVSADGERATRERPYFDWGYVCPSREEYRAGLVETIADCAAVAPDVRLDDVGFPREGYCYCSVCDRRFAESEHDDRPTWRAATITEFVADAAAEVPGRTYFTLYPDPYPGHLYRRSGIDVDAIAEYVDEFVVPLYDTAYGTTYWIEAIASAFAERLPKPVSVELYAVDIDVDALLRAATVAEAYAESVIFGYDASTARAALRRRAAEDGEGVEHRPGSDDGA